LQLFEFGRGGEMCVAGGFLGILRVGDAIWGRADLRVYGGWGWWSFSFDALHITIVSSTFWHKLFFVIYMNNTIMVDHHGLCIYFHHRYPKSYYEF
jgi:hypothetical protein